MNLLGKILERDTSLKDSGKENNKTNLKKDELK